MYVCVCHAINDRKVQQAVCDGACSAAEIFRAHGVRPQCGRCVGHMRQMIDGQPEKAANSK